MYDSGISHLNALGEYDILLLVNTLKLPQQDPPIRNPHPHVLTQERLHLRYILGLISLHHILLQLLHRIRLHPLVRMPMVMAAPGPMLMPVVVCVVVVVVVVAMFAVLVGLRLLLRLWLFLLLLLFLWLRLPLVPLFF
uniref:Uncharacterized protein n=1 Tax=Arcella intermedia TaxID=1963864 RepID=A0A6B2LIL3_9EUKA